jgi:hypothetical protein
MDAILTELEGWKIQPFSDNEIPYVHAAESLDSDEPLVEVRPVGLGSRWMVSIFFSSLVYTDMISCGIWW